MALQDKYKQLLDAASTAGIQNLDVKEQEGVLYVSGDADSGTKQKLWDIYESIDPDYSGGDLMLNINSITGVAEGSSLKITTAQSNLNIRAGAGTDFPIVGKAARGEVVTLVRKENDQWWVIKTQDGEEGYSFTQYLTPVNS